MLGGQHITLSTPCIDPSATIMASFSGSTKYMCERESLLSIVCITPAFNTTGEIIIDVEIKDQDQTITRTLQYSYTVRMYLPLIPHMAYITPFVYWLYSNLNIKRKLLQKMYLLNRNVSIGFQFWYVLMYNVLVLTYNGKFILL